MRMPPVILCVLLAAILTLIPAALIFSEPDTEATEVPTKALAKRFAVSETRWPNAEVLLDMKTEREYLILDRGTPSAVITPLLLPIIRQTNEEK